MCWVGKRNKVYRSIPLPPVGTPSHLLNSRALVHWFVTRQLAPSCPPSEDTEMGWSAGAGQAGPAAPGGSSLPSQVLHPQRALCQPAHALIFIQSPLEAEKRS